MRGVLTALVAKRPSAGLSARNRRPERNRRKKNCPTDADGGLNLKKLTHYSAPRARAGKTPPPPRTRPRTRSRTFPASGTPSRGRAPTERPRARRPNTARSRRARGSATRGRPRHRRPPAPRRRRRPRSSAAPGPPLSRPRGPRRSRRRLPGARAASRSRRGAPRPALLDPITRRRRRAAPAPATAGALRGPSECVLMPCS